MQKEKLIPCFVISTIIYSRKNYISDSFTNLMKKYVPYYSLVLEDSKPFETEEKAKNFIANISNAYNRELTIETAELPESVFKVPNFSEAAIKAMS